MAGPSYESVASRVLRFPRAASQQARNRLTALFTAAATQAPVARAQRSQRSTPATCRYMLRSMRRQQD